VEARRVREGVLGSRVALAALEHMLEGLGARIQGRAVEERPVRTVLVPLEAVGAVLVLLRVALAVELEGEEQEAPPSLPTPLGALEERRGTGLSEGQRGPLDLTVPVVVAETRVTRLPPPVVRAERGLNGRRLLPEALAVVEAEEETIL